MADKDDKQFRFALRWPEGRKSIDVASVLPEILQALRGTGIKDDKQFRFALRWPEKAPAGVDPNWRFALCWPEGQKSIDVASVLPEILQALRGTGIIDEEA